METSSRIAVIATICVAGASMIAGSSSTSIPPTYGQEWFSGMDSMMSGYGGGGGYGRIAPDPQDPTNDGSNGRVVSDLYLQEGIVGKKDVLGVCQSPLPMHLRVRTFTMKDGADVDLKTLAEGDISCGAMLRLHIDVPKGTDGIDLELSTNDLSGHALWEASVVDPNAGN